MGLRVVPMNQCIYFTVAEIKKICVSPKAILACVLATTLVAGLPSLAGALQFDYCSDISANVTTVADDKDGDVDCQSDTVVWVELSGIFLAFIVLYGDLSWSSMFVNEVKLDTVGGGQDRDISTANGKGGSTSWFTAPNISQPTYETSEMPLFRNNCRWTLSFGCNETERPQHARLVCQ